VAGSCTALGLPQRLNAGDKAWSSPTASITREAAEELGLAPGHEINSGVGAARRRRRLRRLRGVAENKTKPTDADVDAFLDAVESVRRREGARRVVTIMREVKVRSRSCGARR
jgi:hypothetical protein